MIGLGIVLPGALLGAIGVGLVWGWLVGGLAGQVLRPHRTLAFVGGGTVLTAAMIALSGGKWGLVAFGISSIIMALLHAGWRAELTARRGQRKTNHLQGGKDEPVE